MKTALVTGANKGIGFHIACGLLRAGFRVVLGCRNLELASRAAAQMTEECRAKPEQLMVLHMDLADEATIRSAAADLRNKSASASAENPRVLDVLVNNAGFAFTHDAKEPVGVQASVTVKTNYFGTLSVCNEFLPLIKDGGQIINVSSRAGLLQSFSNAELQQRFLRKDLTVPELSQMMTEFVRLAQSNEHRQAGWPDTTYGAAKAGLSALSRILASDPAVVARGIRVNAMCPGWCKTDMAGWDEPPKTAEQGADTALWLALDEKTHRYTGQFLAERRAISYVDGKPLEE